MKHAHTISWVLFALLGAITILVSLTCLHHSEFGAAVRAGAVAEDSDCSFGEMLSLASPDPRMARDGVSVVDLTGMGVQDLAIAMVTLRELTG